MAQVEIFKVLELPPVLEANAIYLQSEGGKLTVHVTNLAGTATLSTFTQAQIQALIDAAVPETADALTNARDFNVAGYLTGTAVSFDGTGNVLIDVTAIDPAGLSAPVPITKGGTGGATVAEAQENLGINSLATGPLEPFLFA